MDARNEGVDIVINARTDTLVLGWEEAIYRANKFAELGADMVFIEALPDRASMEAAAKQQLSCSAYGKHNQGRVD